MNRDEIQKLLGGYATGTLTPEERRVLFEAALDDQELFDTLAREEALREVLSDPATRAQLLAAMDEAPAPWYRRMWSPVPMAALAAVVLLVSGVAVWQNSRIPQNRRMAKLELPPPPLANQGTPILPPPPEIARTAPVLSPYPLPAPAPTAPPLPPAEAKAALAQDTAATVSGSPASIPQAQLGQAGAQGGLRPAPSAAATVSGSPPSIPQAQQGQAGVQAGLGLARSTSATVSGSPASTPQAQQGQAEMQSGLRPAPSNAPMGFAAGRAVPAPNNVPLRGTVTDSTGAAIRSAAVVVKSLGTGEAKATTTSTGEHGEFSAPAVPGSAYQISVSAPGFRTATANGIVPASGTPEPVNLQLAVGEGIQVRVAAEALVSAGARGGRGGGGAFMAKTAAPAIPALEYHLLERTPGGNLVEIPAEGTVPAGAAMILRVTPRTDGYLQVADSSGRTIAGRQVQGRQVFETALPEFHTAGRVELRMYFSPQAFESYPPTPTATVAFNIQ